MAPRKADPEHPVESETSETSESSLSEEDAPTVVPRKKVPLNEARLEQLRQAREKAAEARKRIGDVKRAEKALKERELQARIERVQAMEKQLLKKTPPIPIKKRKHAPPPPSSSSESESESSSSEEEREATRWVASSSTDGGHRPRKSKHSRRARSLPQRAAPAVDAHKQQVHALAYGSLFPGAGNNPYV